MSTLSWDIRDIKKIQVSPLQTKMTVSRIKNTLDGMENRKDQDEQISEFKDSNRNYPKWNRQRKKSWNK